MRSRAGFFVVLLILVSSVALLFSCATTPDVSSYSDFRSLQDINIWINGHIRYDGIDKSIDEAQSPEMTLSLRSGCCIDQCNLFVYLAKESGWTVKVLPIQTRTGYHTIIDAGSSGYFDPTSGQWLGYSLKDGWSVTTF